VVSPIKKKRLGSGINNKVLLYASLISRDIKESHPFFVTKPMKGFGGSSAAYMVGRLCFFH